MVNLCKKNIFTHMVKMGGCSGCLRSDRVYSARRLRLRDNLPPPAKARPRGAGAAVRLRSTHMVAGMTKARGRMMSI